MKSPEKIALIDRGRAKHFHGREEEIQLVQKMLYQSKEEGKGISFLIQGPPGVGKTALLWELRRIGKELNWDIRKMNFEALWNPNELYRVLIRDHKYKKNFKEWG
ncbi:MAG: AAA family ATPase [Flavobacteriaceae bacterium]|nr:AAA family ATPase [Flavobacteriaceae bacterium]MCY4268276.1 AAA family ATPase [Flavobacteriaceae bacterium]